MTPIDTADLERLDDILRDPLSGLTWDNRIMAADAIRELLNLRVPRFDGDAAEKAEVNCHCDRLHPSDLCASGRQVRATDAACEALARAYDREDAAQRGEPDPWSIGIEEEPEWVAGRIACARAGLAALTPAPDAAQEQCAKNANCSAHQLDMGDGRILTSETPIPELIRAPDAAQTEAVPPMPSEMRYVPTITTDRTTHPAAPAPGIAEAVTRSALDACRIIDAAVLEGHDSVSDLICHLLEAVEPARAALRALANGESHD
ncbi:hypothetical protein SAMN04244548_01227 [Paracoccus pantotrophus]|nr:hypothetical protein SAMN04244548_01227 [Paracoccus pantotrophus]